ncbi:GNAT family N-acetyltransferase [Actinoplanes sp. NEAU-A12]|uniref:GNAT family N-acetyltransferase n=1 Tax=Actinoplanes sandaracinus TaxID=3045177 RepID=A0ABT6WVH0_9ACTN|nr:GNAT family N-acetyltransferase [Actinoplanes sandaracinus]MDI6103626.1 GNAT family N-acetyltransferase [Actinoplanes sandaracinus]
MTAFRLEPWDDRAPELQRRANTPQMQEFLAGVEPDEALVSRHRRILDGIKRGTTEMFLIVIDDAGPVGSIGYWQKQWRGETVYELGWKVLPEFQGRGLAGRALTRTLAHAAGQDRIRWGHAFPRADNVASNSLCRQAGFELLGEVDFEFPKGNPLRCNDWRHDLSAIRGRAGDQGRPNDRS